MNKPYWFYLSKWQCSVVMISILFCGLTSYSQEELSFRYLGEEHGLLDNRFNSFVTKDSRGFVWISSMQGCYRFDGKTIKPYLLSEEIDFSDNVQSSFYEDANQDLWFTTVNALVQYDRKRDAFDGQQFTKDSIKLADNYHAFHLTKSTGQLWLTAGGYMWAYNVVEKKNESNYFKTNAKRFLVDTFENGDVNKIFAFPWFNNPGFELWTKSGESFEKMEFHETGILNRLRISNGYIQNDSIVWLITNEGLVEYNYSDKVVVQLYKPKGEKHFNLWDGLLFKNNQLLLSANGSGLWGFDLVGKQFTENWKHTDTDQTTIRSDAPKEIYLDYEDQLWVTQYSNGLDFTTLTKLDFFNPLEKIGIVDVVHSIEEDNQGRVWVLTRNNGIFVFSLDQTLLYRFKSIGAFTDFSTAKLSIDNNGQPWLFFERSIYFLNGAKELNNSNWVLTCRTDEKIFNLYHPPLKEDMAFVITSTQIYHLLKDEKNRASRLVKSKQFNGHNNFEFYSFHQVNDTTTYIPYGQTDLWVLEQNGLNFSISEKVAFNAIIYDVLQSRDDKTIWIASNEGLYKRELNSDSLAFVKNKQVGSRDIYACVEDRSQKLWLTTDDGIYSFDKTGKDLFRFTTKHGLSSNLFKEEVGILDSKGNVWFGNEKGLTVFDPSAISPTTFSVRTYIDKAWINNKEFKFRTSINELEEISFPYFENTFDFSLKTIGVGQSETTTILYRLKNYDDAWATSKNGSLARFTKVPPGEYYLEAIPIDENNRRGIGKQLKVIISIPFWQTMTFKVLMLSGIAFLIAIGFGIYFQNQLRKQKRLVEKQIMINTERDRIGKELHDDIGGGLSSILFLSEDLKYGEKDPTKIEQADRISILTQNALTNMRDIIWALDTEQNSLKDLVARLQDYSNTYLSDHYININFTVNIPISEQIKLTSKVKRNLFLMLKECLHNIVKHAKADTVFANILADNNQLQLNIKDNGIGFNSATLTSNGNGLENLKFRTKVLNGKMDIQTEPNKGTCISFVIPLT